MRKYLIHYHYKTLMYFKSSALWFLPFLCFSSGYLLTRVILHHTMVTVPSLVGKTADIALVQLSEKNLNPRIIGLVDEPDLEPGTIITQIPRAEAQARPYQTIFLVISSRPSKHIAKQWIGLKQEAIAQSCAADHISPLFIAIPHTLPAGHCFAQFPSEGSVIIDRPIFYIAAQAHQKYIWPSLIDAPAFDAFEALKKQGVTIHIIGENTNAMGQELKELRIIDQRPLPGSFVTYDGMHPPSIHVRLGR
jgi:beta-lactam-binding protein with PASTA domain